MNTVKSFWIGWGSLIIAGGGAYYYAKKEIDASRREKFLKLQRQQQLNADLEFDSKTSPGGRTTYTSKHNSPPPELDLVGLPSEEATADPAPGGHEPSSSRDGPNVGEKSKYEAAVPYRSRKGDRFS